MRGHQSGQYYAVGVRYGGISNTLSSLLIDLREKILVVHWFKSFQEPHLTCMFYFVLWQKPYMFGLIILTSFELIIMVSLPSDPSSGLKQ